MALDAAKADGWEEMERWLARFERLPALYRDTDLDEIRPVLRLKEWFVEDAGVLPDGTELYEVYVEKAAPIDVN